ncbi:FCD domain-containing protein [Fluviibacterium sp. DFM31]|uniref:FCD domain-containing protein n=1 Tax=Meridianimarinicoccus marinus TaxID=3231483 RepID=A0ABV3L2L9_9RHOB
MLGVEGLVEYSSSRRPHVADPSLHELSEYISVLRALEVRAGEAACREATLVEIADIVCPGACKVEGSDSVKPLEFFRLDRQFHVAIVEASRNEQRVETHRQYNAGFVARFLSSQQVNRRNNKLAQHSRISDGPQERYPPATGCAL